MGHEGGSGSGGLPSNPGCRRKCARAGQTLRTKSQVWPLEAMKLLQKRSPFPWLTKASDNGASSSPNLIRFCEQARIQPSAEPAPRARMTKVLRARKTFRWLQRAVAYARSRREREQELPNDLLRSAAMHYQLFQVPVIRSTHVESLHVCRLTRNINKRSLVG